MDKYWLLAFSVSLLFIFGTLFGLWGAFLSVPVVGIIQVFVVAYWQEWKRNHPEEFPEGRVQKDENISITPQDKVQT